MSKLVGKGGKDDAPGDKDHEAKGDEHKKKEPGKEDLERIGKELAKQRPREINACVDVISPDGKHTPPEITTCTDKIGQDGKRTPPEITTWTGQIKAATLLALADRADKSGNKQNTEFYLGKNREIEAQLELTSDCKAKIRSSRFLEYNLFPGKTVFA